MKRILFIFSMLISCSNFKLNSYDKDLSQVYKIAYANSHISDSLRKLLNIVNAAKASEIYELKLTAFKGVIDTLKEDLNFLKIMKESSGIDLECEKVVRAALKEVTHYYLVFLSEKRE